MLVNRKEVEFEANQDFQCLMGRVQLAHKLKSVADAFLDETCGSSRHLDYATWRSTCLRMFSGVQAEPLQFLVKVRKLYIYLWI